LRMENCGGKWFGNYETPAIPSKIGKQKLKRGQPLDTSGYGRKESEGRDFNEDTNFGKLKRIPHPALQAFLRKHRLVGAKKPGLRRALKELQKIDERELQDEERT